MGEHNHSPNEYCDRCRPALEADFGAGEQFWRHWSSPIPVAFPGGRKARVKILSKRSATGKIEFVCLREFEDRSKAVFAEGYFGRDDQLVSFVGGMDLAFKVSLDNPQFGLVMTDFRDCDTIQKWEYRMREGTDNFEVWNDPGERPRKEDSDGHGARPGDPGHQRHDPDGGPEEDGKGQPDSPPRPPGQEP